MNKTTRLVSMLVLILVLIGAGAYIYHVNTSSSAAKGEADARATVEAFGKQLQLVSLLAPADSIEGAMNDAYGPYVDPDLLDSWIASPVTAPGRTTSSPWPDHILITSADLRSSGSYDVTGQVIEVTSTGQEVSGTPVEMRLEKEGNKWRITRFEGYPAQ